MRKYYITLFFTLLTIQLWAAERILRDEAAERRINGSKLIRYTDLSELPNYVAFRNQEGPGIQNLNQWLAQHLAVGKAFGLTELSRVADELGYLHIRYRQFYQGIPIQGTMWNVHVKNGMVESMGGVLFKSVQNLDTQAGITPETALQIALGKVQAIEYKWQNPAEEALLKHEQQDASATYYPKASTWILNKDGMFHLCYAFNIYANLPLGRTMEYVDAHNGKIVLSRNLIEHVNTNGTAVTKYSATQVFQTDSTAPSAYRLRDASRGLGVQTYNMNHTSTYGSATDFTDADNYWNNVNPNHDEAATDAHWGAQKTYDYFNVKYGRNSIDDAGFALKSYVHYNTNYANAFWDGTRMTYGDGSNSSGFMILTGLDVCGHEIGHGLTNFTADLSAISSGTAECDALNEGYSDIFGTAVERYARPSQWDWIIGADITCTSAGVPNGQGIRSMSNPMSMGQPICYQGTNWSASGEPHDNDGPLNYWFYLLTTGSAANNVVALGHDTSEKIAYRALTVHLFPSADYADARFYSIVASTELYGGCSQATISNTNAWHAVCVGAAYVASPAVSNFTADIVQSCDTILTVNFTNTSVNGNTFTWYFGDGTSSTQYNPTHTYNTGVYNVTLQVNGGSCGNDTLTQSAYIHVGPPPGPVTVGATICNPGTATITATPNNVGDTIKWYAAASGGPSLGTGNSFTTPSVSSTTTYYAEEIVSSPSFHVGPLNNSIGTGGNYTNTTRFLVFDCTSPCILQSVWVMASSAGNRTIIIKNSAGTTIQSVTVNIPNGGSVVTLNMPIPVGTGFQIGLATGSTVNLYRNSTGAVYPYTNGPISITGNTAAGSGSYYYFFYDWVVKGQDCYSVRTPTTVVVGTGSGVTPATITPPASGLTACTPATVVLNANTGAGLSYQWYNGAASIAGATNSSYTAGVTGAYSVVVSSSSGCLSPGTSAAANVQILTPPSATITPAGPTTFCQGGNVLLNANTGSGLSYQWLFNASPVSGATNASYTATQAGNYSVIVANGGNCSSTSATLPVTVNSLPTATLTPSGNVSFCQGGGITFNANTGAGLTYHWYLNGNPIGTALSSSYLATQAGVYYVQVTNANACSQNSPSATVTVNPLPLANVTPAGPTSFCQGGSVVLNANTGTGLNYQWYLNGSPITAATGMSYTATASGNYQVQVINNNNCSATSASVVVSVNPGPGASITPAVSASFCQGGSLLLNANTGTGLTYQWYQGGTLIAGATNAAYTTTTAGNFTVEVSNGTCTQLSAATTVTINALPVASLFPSATQTICEGSGVVLNASTGAGYTYTWYWNGNVISGANASTYTATQAGNYTVKITNASNCSATSAATTVIVTPAPSPVIVNTGGVLSVSGGTFTTYQWLLNGNPIPGATNATYTVTQNGQYSVQVSQNGCQGTSAAVNLTGVGIDDVTQTTVKLHPNPVRDMLLVEGLIPGRMTLRDMQGRIVREVKRQSAMQVSDLSNGIYLLMGYDLEGKLLLKERILKQ